MKKTYLLCAFISTIVISCSNEETDPVAYTPTITFIEPEEGEEINSGEEIHMEVDFNFDGHEIFKVGLLLINTDAGDTVVNYEEDANTQDFYNLHEHYETDVADTTHYTVVAFSSNEDGSETVSNERHVTVNP